MPLFVQAASNTGGASFTVTLGSNATATNCLVACIAMGSAGSLASVASVKLGGVADNWAQLKAVGDLTTGAEQLATWADPNCAGGSTAVAIALNVATVGLAWVFEFSGIAASGILDQFATFDSAGGTNSTFSVTSGATTQASEVAVGCVYGFNTTITGPSSPWVNESTITSTTRTLQAGYDILSSTGTVTYSGSFGAAEFNGQILVTLFTPSATVSGTAQPRAAVPVPRRRLARAVWARITGQAYVAVPAPRQEYQLAPRRKPARAVWRAGAGQAYVAVPAPVQQFRTAPRRKLARAYVQFIPVVTTNAAGGAGVAGTVPALMVNQTRVAVRRDGRVVRQ